MRFVGWDVNRIVFQYTSHAVRMYTHTLESSDFSHGEYVNGGTIQSECVQRNEDQISSICSTVVGIKIEETPREI